MARAYTGETDNISVSLVQDLASIQTTAGMVAEIDEIVVGQVTATSVGNLRVTFKRFSGAFTIGSVGASVTPSKHVFGDSAAVCVQRGNDTTQTSGGTSVKLSADAINVINGFQKLPAPEDRWSFTISQAFVFSLDAAPGSAETMSAAVTFREIV